jgi:hypothetical protein
VKVLWRGQSTMMDCTQDEGMKHLWRGQSTMMDCLPPEEGMKYLWRGQSTMMDCLPDEEVFQISVATMMAMAYCWIIRC